MLKALWSDEVPDLVGDHYVLTDAAPLGHPKPVQRPHPPLWLGSSGARYGLRVVAEYADGWFSAAMPGAGPEGHARISAVLDRHCAEVGRDPATIRRAVQFPLPPTVGETLRTVAAYRQAGFNDIVLMLTGAGDARITAADAAAEVLPALRELG